MNSFVAGKIQRQITRPPPPRRRGSSVRIAGDLLLRVSFTNQLEFKINGQDVQGGHTRARTSAQNIRIRTTSSRHVPCLVPSFYKHFTEPSMLSGAFSPGSSHLLKRKPWSVQSSGANELHISPTLKWGRSWAGFFPTCNICCCTSHDIDYWVGKAGCRVV